MNSTVVENMKRLHMACGPCLESDDEDLEIQESTEKPPFHSNELSCYTSQDGPIGVFFKSSSVELLEDQRDRTSSSNL